MKRIDTYKNKINTLNKEKSSIEGDLLMGIEVESNNLRLEEINIEIKRAELKIRTIEEKENVLEEEENVFLKKVKETANKLENFEMGSDNLFYGYDIINQSFVRIDIETNNVIYYERTRMVTKIMKEMFVSKKVSNAVIDYIPDLRLDFNPLDLRRLKKDNNGDYILNKFKPTKSLLLEKKEKISREQFEETFEKKYPSIYLLINNIMNEDKVMVKHIINWLSYILQTRKKTGQAFIIYGSPGTGKGLFYKYIVSYMLGERNCKTIGTSQLQSVYNSWARDNLFVLGNEIKGNFKEGNAAYETLKGVITDEILPYNEKYEKGSDFTSYSNMLIFANKLPIQIDPDDRRYSVVLCELKLKEKTDTKKLVDNIKLERDNFFQDLMNVDYSTYDATLCLETEDKKILSKLTSSVIDVIEDTLKNNNIEELEILFGDVDIDNSYDESMYEELIFDMNNNIIKNKVAIWLYNKISGKELTDQAIGRLFTKGFGNSLQKKINKKVLKYKVINNKKEYTFETNMVKKVEIIKESHQKFDIKISNKIED